MAKQHNRNHFSDYEKASSEDDGDPIHEFKEDREFLKALESFQPETQFDKQLVKGVIFRDGKLPMKLMHSEKVHQS